MFLKFLIFYCVWNKKKSYEFHFFILNGDYLTIKTIRVITLRAKITRSIKAAVTRPIKAAETRPIRSIEKPCRSIKKTRRRSI